MKLVANLPTGRRSHVENLTTRWRQKETSKPGHKGVSAQSGRMGSISALSNKGLSKMSKQVWKFALGR